MELCKSTRIRARAGSHAHDAFTLVELLVVLAVVAVLVGLQIPSLAGAQGQSRQAQCAANLRQLALAELTYANEHFDRLPSTFSGNWLWDAPVSTTSQLSTYGAKRQQFYCPANPDQNLDGLWNFVLGGGSPYRVTGYSGTFQGSATLIASNANPVIIPPQLVFAGVGFPGPVASKRVLVADVILSQGGQVTTSQKLNYTYTGIIGGYAGPPPGFRHRSSHMDLANRYPTGANVGMLDGHVEWNKFANVICRTTGAAPGFWW